MGLPLFVAPVESDIPARASDKSPAHVRSSIRRVRRLDEREMRAVRARRTGILEAALDPPEPSTSGPGRPPARAPWPPMGGSADSPYYFPSSRRYPVDERSHALWPNPPPPPPPYVRQETATTSGSGSAVGDMQNLGYTMRRMERGAAPRPDDYDHPAVNAFLGRFRDGTDPASRAGAPMDREPPDAVTNQELLFATQRRQFEEAMNRLSSVHAAHPYAAARRRTGASSTVARFARSPPRRTAGRPAQRSASTARSVSFHDAVTQQRQQEGVDGLGDRDRSLSPGDAQWDTLLSTLTPDPQPPSVGSSFASASASASGNASQPSASAGGSSRTSLTGPEMADEVADEQPCESGRDNSDSENEDAIDRYVRRTRYRFPLSDFTPFSQPGFPPNPSGDPAGGRTGLDDLFDVNDHPMVRRRPWNAMPPVTSHERTRRSRSAGNENAADGPAETDVADAPASNGTGNAAAAGNHGSNNSQGDEDAWDGMQEIVRNLAAREDIPDDWWSAAGLSRTLPREPSN